jgi:diadenosine tetraphosphate (Ap4A) HIT family hydrolase
MAWTDPAAWSRLLEGAECGMCADAHLETNQFSQLVAELRQSYVRLAHNQYRRGYTVVILKRHANELFELSDTELAGYWRDVADTAAALQRLFGAVKINYAVLGNGCPHIHCHLVPLYAADNPPRLLDMGDGEVLLDGNAFAQIVADLRRELGRHAELSTAPVPNEPCC